MRIAPRTLAIVGAGAALAIPSASSAGVAPATGPSGQTVRLNAYQSGADAAWQKRTWQASARFCRKKVNGVPRWRRVIKDGVCGTVVQTAPLTAGQTYQVTVAGLITHWPGAWRRTCGAPIPTHDDDRGADYNASADAQWTFAVRKGRFFCSILKPYLPTAGAGFRVNTLKDAAPQGWKYPWMGQSKNYVKTNHTYSFTVTGAGRPVWFSLYDHWTTDNFGHFDITVAPVAAPAAG